MLAAKHAGVADAGGVVEQRIEAGLAEMLQHGLGDRKVFGAARGGAGGDRVKAAMPGPEHVVFAGLHALDVGQKTLVGLQRHIGLKMRVGRGRRDAVGAAISRGGQPRAQFGESALLRGHGVVSIPQFSHGAGGEETSSYVEQASRRREHTGRLSMRQLRPGRTRKRIHAACRSLRAFNPR